MQNWSIAGALVGAMIGVFVAREFTDHGWIWLGAGFVGSCIGIVLGVVLVRRKPE